jgi:CHAT domain-containing protein
VTRSVRDLGLRQLLPLPYARLEAQAIQAFAPPARRFVAVGADASLALVTRGALALYQILHFASHALIHPSAPELSGIVLAAPDAAGHPRPGFLQSFEISELHLAAELVVLSACRTGLGPEVHGEGLLGLTQSFFQAGATRIVVSLWDVDDRATAVLMERFYTELLLHHQPPAAALRTAQLALRADPRFAAPYYWAGFELQGDWRALP